MKIPKVPNRDARQFVQNRKPFTGSNLYGGWIVGGWIVAGEGETREERYVVYSYGRHWPLFIYTNGVWFENEDKYGMTTSKHRSQSHPLCTTVRMPREQMLVLADCGYQHLARERVLHGVAV